MRLKYSHVHFEGIVSREVAKLIADKANEVYYEHVFQQPRLCGILTTSETYIGFDDHQGEYDNLSGYLVETREIKK